MTIWQFIFGSLATFCITILGNTYIFGRRAGNQEAKLESLCQDLQDAKDEYSSLRSEMTKIRSAFESYTGRSVEGVDFRSRRRGEHD